MIDELWVQLCKTCGINSAHLSFHSGNSSSTRYSVSVHHNDIPITRFGITDYEALTQMLQHLKELNAKSPIKPDSSKAKVLEYLQDNLGGALCKTIAIAIGLSESGVNRALHFLQDSGLIICDSDRIWKVKR